MAPQIIVDDSPIWAGRAQSSMQLASWLLRAAHLSPEDSSAARALDLAGAGFEAGQACFNAIIKARLAAFAKNAASSPPSPAQALLPDPSPPLAQQARDSAARWGMAAFDFLRRHGATEQDSWAAAEGMLAVFPEMARAGARAAIESTLLRESAASPQTVSRAMRM